MRSFCWNEHRSSSLEASLGLWSLHSECSYTNSRIKTVLHNIMQFPGLLLSNLKSADLQYVRYSGDITGQLHIHHQLWMKPRSDLPNGHNVVKWKYTPIYPFSTSYPAQQPTGLWLSSALIWDKDNNNNLFLIRTISQLYIFHSEEMWAWVAMNDYFDNR